MGRIGSARKRLVERQQGPDRGGPAVQFTVTLPCIADETEIIVNTTYNAQRGGILPQSGPTVQSTKDGTNQ